MLGQKSNWSGISGEGLGFNIDNSNHILIDIMRLRYYGNYVNYVDIDEHSRAKQKP